MKPTISSNKMIMITLFLSICLLSIPLTSAVKDENGTSYSYTPGAIDGPEHWGELSDEWQTCGTGLAQSPIDISTQSVEEQPNLGSLVKSYWPSRATLKRRSHHIELKWKNEAGSIFINDTKYDLTQLHWHYPSEHTIDGKRYDMEMHVVHKSSDNKTAVIGILYEYGHPDSFLTRLEPYIRSMSLTKSKEEPIGIVNPEYAMGFGKKYYRYMGSLTTPPCTEGVVWTIAKKVKSVSREQVQMLKEAVDNGSEDNARPLQNINGRVVGFYKGRKFTSHLFSPLQNNEIYYY
ncbi:dioscorin DB3L-like [Carex rostrata]